MGRMSRADEYRRGDSLPGFRRLLLHDGRESGYRRRFSRVVGPIGIMQGV